METARGEIAEDETKIDEEETKKDEEETTKPGGDDGEVKDASEGEEAPEEETEEFYRVFEYDLQEFTKIKTLDLKYYGSEFSEEVLHGKDFGIYKEGLFYMKVKQLDEKNMNIEVFLKDVKYSMDSSEKFENLECAWMNEKGDRSIVCYIKDGNYILQKYQPDVKDKKLKKAEEIKIKNENFEMTSESIDIKIKPLANDFIIYIKKKKETKYYIYLNDTFITTTEFDID